MSVPEPFSLVLAAVLAALAGLEKAAAAGPGFRTGEQPYSVALHMHSSFSEGDGSYEWHSDKATQYGLDAIWWSEHDWRSYHLQFTKQYTFENTIYESAFARWSEPDEAFPGEYRYWQLSGPTSAIYVTNVVDSLSIQGSKSFYFFADDPLDLSTFKTVYFHQECSNKQSKYNLSSRVKIRFSVYPEKLDPNGKFVMEMGMSKHPTGDHVLRYVLGTMDGEPATSTSLPFNFNVWNTYELDVTADAIAKFTSGGLDSLRGEDNALFRLRMGMEVRNGASAKVFVDDFRYLVDTTLTPEYFVDKQGQFADYYETLYPNVRQIVGTEISKFRAQPHLNAFTPSPMLVDYGTHVWSDTIYYAVDQVHAVGGAVSMNHLFGSGIYGNLNETPAQKAQRVHNRKLEMLATRVYHADMLEVGYRVRGGIVLEDHLDTWDTVTGNGIYVTGNGVTDSHGTTPFNGWGPWQPTAPHENNFTTWLYAKEISEIEFIRAMLGGRAFFGDPNLFEGTLDLSTAEGFPMGRVILTDRAQHDLLVHIEPVPADVQVRLLQGEIRTSGPQYLVVNFLRDEVLSGTVAGEAFSDTVALDTTLPSFTRIEVRSGEGEEWAFSNPIHLIRELPSLGIPPLRVAGVLGPITIRSAENFTWKSAAFDSVAATLQLGGDESPVGEGSIEIDCGTLGMPGTVVGAASHSFDAGILTVSGFSGPGSTINVYWGAIGVLDQIPSVREVSLGTGHPNPFRDAGMMCEFALPRAGHVRLHVHDIQGRLVRVLVDEKREAGIHRASWDGLDSHERPAANGVYFLRLEAEGRSLTSKAVKTR
jgi:hypothetical protein